MTHIATAAAPFVAARSWTKALVASLLALSTAGRTVTGQVIMPRYEGPVTPAEQRWRSGLAYRPSESPVRWLADGTLIVAHAEQYNRDDMYASQCGGTGLFAVPSSGRGVARPLAVGAPACEFVLTHRGGTLDPTGTWGVFSDDTPPDNSALRRLDMRTGAVDSVRTGCLVYIMHPDVSPDGRLIAAQGLCLSRESEYELYLMQADGSRLRRLGPADSVSSETPRWSPDGAHLVYVRTSHYDAYDKQTFDIVVSDTGAQSRRRIAAGVAPAWSPTGEWIAYLAAHPERRGEYEIRLVTPDGSRDRPLFRNDVSTQYFRGFGARSEGEISGPLVWSPDGRALAFRRAFDRQANVWVVTLEDGRVRRVTGMDEGRP